MIPEPSARTGPCTVGWAACWLGLSLLLTACGRDPARQASESDANGYLCLRCGLKLYCARDTYLGPQCPGCQQDSLMNVVGYRCERDHHLTIRASRGDARGAVCELCQATLQNAMVLPRERDLKAWGAKPRAS